MSKPCPLPPNPPEAVELPAGVAVVNLSPSDQALLAEALLDESAEPAPAMVRAAKHYKRLIGK